jgi:hypothetical protein
MECGSRKASPDVLKPRNIIIIIVIYIYIKLHNNLLKGVWARWFKTNKYKYVNNISGGRISEKVYQLPAQALEFSPTLRSDRLHVLPAGDVQVYIC